jgi:hypothetical protein
MIVWLCLVIQDFGRSRAAKNRLCYGPFSHWRFYDWIYVENWISYLNLRLDEETKGLQIKYHQMGRVIVDKMIFGALCW